MNLLRRHLLAATGALALPAWGRSAPALMQGQDAPPGIDPAGYLVSEKLDGVRAVWDGRQLRFRSGLPVAAPAWFIAALPAEPLDGELWLGRGRFEAVSGLVRRRHPDDAAWRTVSYQVFDQPGMPGPFAQRAGRLQGLVDRTGWAPLQAVTQRRVASLDDLQKHLRAVVEAGGEGLMLHRADALWRPGRSSSILKLKPLADAEAVVVGHVPGRGRHAGRLGALRVRRPDGRRFLLGTGFSDAERDAPPPAGSVVTYAYRGFTDDGLPRFASYLRVRSTP
jgi:DNA ligase-1